MSPQERCPPSPTPRLMQMYFAFMRGNGLVRLTRADASVLNGECMVTIRAQTDECREFDNAAEAEAFIRETMAAGDVIGIVWPEDQKHVFIALQRYGLLLDELREVDVHLIGQGGYCPSRVSVDNLADAAAVLGYAVLAGLYTEIVEVEE